MIGPGGRPIEIRQRLIPGQDIDRYGSEFGSFLSPAGLPYPERSIPPQPGYGWQYQLSPALLPGAPSPLNVMWLVSNGCLQRLS